MIVTATGLILLGGVSALLGLSLVRALLPILGLITGFLVGFTGVQAVFGTGVIALPIALIVALIVGVIMGVLSFSFLEVGVIGLSGVIGATILTYLALALGLQDNGVVMTLLGVSGAILGVIYAAANPLSTKVVIAVTSFLGISMILAGVMLIAGGVSIEQLQETGIVRSVLGVVDQELLWLMAWLGGGLIAMNVQNKTAKLSDNQGTLNV